MKKLTIGIAVTILIAAVAGLLWQQHLLKQATVEIAGLQDRVATEIPDLQLENQGLRAQLKETEERMESNLADLMRLRGQSTKQRQLEQENARLKAAGDRMALAQAQAAELALAQTQAEVEPGSPDQTHGPGTSDRMMQARGWASTLKAYAEAHEGQYPAQLSDAGAFLMEGIAEADRTRMLAEVSRFELVYHGNSKDLPAPPAEPAIVVRERLPTYGINGEWVKVYGIADGSAEVRTSRSGDFSQWEGQQ